MEENMNLDDSPTKEQLRELLAECNDRAGDHLLWVDKTGDVRISIVPPRPKADEMQLQYENFEKGNEYVGASAAADDQWVSQLFESLLKEWPKAKGKAQPELIELV
jgi:hypothetical protein